MNNFQPTHILTLGPDYEPFRRKVHVCNYLPDGPIFATADGPGENEHYRAEQRKFREISPVGAEEKSNVSIAPTGNPAPSGMSGQL